MSCENRYHRRRMWWRGSGVKAHQLRHHGWWLLHNCVSHPLLGVLPTKRAIHFHDWTSKHLNLRDHIRPSHAPVIKNRIAWAWHNIVGHVAIGVLPIKASFDFHDRTCEQMAVKDWL